MSLVRGSCCGKGYVWICDPSAARDYVDICGLCHSLPKAVLISSRKYTASALQLPLMLPSGKAQGELLSYATVHLDFSRNLAHLLLLSPGAATAAALSTFWGLDGFCFSIAK